MAAKDIFSKFPSKIPPNFVSKTVAELLPPRDTWASMTTDQLLKLKDKKDELTQLVASDPVRFFRPSPGGQYDFLTTVEPSLQGLYFFAGNKTGKTTGAAILVSENAAGTPLWGRDYRTVRDLLVRGRTPLRICAFCEDFTTHAETIIPSILSWVPRRLLAARAVEPGPSGNYVSVRFANGSVIYLRTYDQGYAKAEGKDYDLVWCDEPPDRSIYTAIFRGLVATKGRLIIAATLLSEVWLYDELEKPFVRIFEASMYDNPWLDDEGRRNFDSLLTEEERQTRITGKPSTLHGKIYPSFVDRPPFIVPEQHCIWDVTKEEPYPIIMGVDPHERKPLHIAWAWLCPGNKIVWFDWALIPSGTLSDVFAALKRHEDAHTGPTRLVVMDPNRGAAKQMNDQSWEEAFLEHEYDVILGSDDLKFGHSQLREMLSTTEPLMQWMESCRGEGGPVYQMSRYVWDNHSRKLAFEKGQKEKPKDLYKDFPDIHRYVACAHLEYNVLSSGGGYETIDIRKAKKNAHANPYLVQR